MGDLLFESGDFRTVERWNGSRLFLRNGATKDPFVAGLNSRPRNDAESAECHRIIQRGARGSRADIKKVHSSRLSTRFRSAPFNP
jgi:hypothetical protein